MARYQAQAAIRYVAKVHDGAAAYGWGLAPGRIVLMVHSGSLSLGHQANSTDLDQVRAAWPASTPTLLWPGADEVVHRRGAIPSGGPRG